MSKHTLLSLALPQRLTHVTVATLSPRITMGSPTDSGVSPANASINHAVTTIPNSSSKLIVMYTSCVARPFVSVRVSGPAAGDISNISFY